MSNRPVTSSASTWPSASMMGLTSGSRTWKKDRIRSRASSTLSIAPWLCRCMCSWSFNVAPTPANSAPSSRCSCRKMSPWARSTRSAGQRPICRTGTRLCKRRTSGLAVCLRHCRRRKGLLPLTSLCRSIIRWMFADGTSASTMSARSRSDSGYRLAPSYVTAGVRRPLASTLPGLSRTSRPAARRRRSAVACLVGPRLQSR